MKKYVINVQKRLAEIAVLVPSLVDAAEASGSTLDDCQGNLARVESALAAIAEVVADARVLVAKGRQ